MSPRHRRQGIQGGPRRTAGFTLIELLIVVAIIGILASIAYPSYQRYVEKSRRAEAQSVLMEVAGNLERCYTSNYKYSSCSPATSAVSAANSESDYYNYSLTSDASTFDVAASPKGSQAGEKCGTLNIDETGETDADQANCW